MTDKMRKIPKQRRSEATVGVIVEACARVLETHGMAGLTTNLVANVAGVSPGSVYQYFPNKEAIISALIRREAEEFLKLGQEAASRQVGLAAMVRFIEAITNHRLQRPRLTLQLILVDPSLAFAPDNVEINKRGHELLLSFIRNIDTTLDLEAASIAVSDTMGIVRGMLISEFTGASKTSDLAARVVSAVTGYWQSRMRSEHMLR